MRNGKARSDPPGGGDPDGEKDIETVIAAHETPLLRYAARLLNNATAAQDVVQTSFLKLCQCWEESRAWTPDHLLHWLYRTTHNAVVDHIRKEERMKKLHETHAQEAAGDDPPRQFEAMELADRQKLALDAMNKLGPAEREVLVLRLQQGLSYADIARVTGRTEGNVGCLLSTASKQLALRLRKTGAFAT